MDIFSHIFVAKICNVCLKRPKINENEAVVGPFYKKKLLEKLELLFIFWTCGHTEHTITTIWTQTKYRFASWPKNAFWPSPSPALTHFVALLSSQAARTLTQSRPSLRNSYANGNTDYKTEKHTCALARDMQHANMTIIFEGLLFN